MNKIVDIYEKIYYQHYRLTLDMVAVDEIYFFTNFLQKKMGSPADCLILDIGCGCGRDVNIFASLGFRVIGVDFCSNSIKFCKEYYKNKLVSFFNYDIFELNFKGEIDGIWCSFVLSHYDFDYFFQVYREIISVFKYRWNLIFGFKGFWWWSVGVVGRA